MPGKIAMDPLALLLSLVWETKNIWEAYSICIVLIVVEVAVPVICGYKSS